MRARPGRTGENTLAAQRDAPEREQRRPPFMPRELCRARLPREIIRRKPLSNETRMD